MKKTTYKPYIEIMPAALLSQRKAWQKIARSLPASACLLVTNPNDTQQAQFMHSLAQSFREKGRQVIVWTVGQ